MKPDLSKKINNIFTKTQNRLYENCTQTDTYSIV